MGSRDLGLRVEGLGFRDLGFRVSGLRFWAQRPRIWRLAFFQWLARFCASIPAVAPEVLLSAYVSRPWSPTKGSSPKSFALGSSV